jgi:hypothetical protein
VLVCVWKLLGLSLFFVRNGVVIVSSALPIVLQFLTEVFSSKNLFELWRLFHNGAVYLPRPRPRCKSKRKRPCQLPETSAFCDTLYFVYFVFTFGLHYLNLEPSNQAAVLFFEVFNCIANVWALWGAFRIVRWCWRSARRCTLPFHRLTVGCLLTTSFLLSCAVLVVYGMWVWVSNIPLDYPTRSL